MGSTSDLSINMDFQLRQPAPMAIEVLHYLTPVLVTLLYILTTFMNSCFLRTKRKPTKQSHLRIAALVAPPVIGVTYIANCVCFIFRALVHKGQYASQDAVFYAFGSVFVWACLYILTLGSDVFHWSQHTGAWLLACALEIALCILAIKLTPPNGAFDTADLVIELIRVVALCTLSTYGLVALIRRVPQTETAASSEEQQPLLAPSSPGSPDGSSTQAGDTDEYGTIKAATDPDHDSDDDEDGDDEETKKAREEQQKRIDEAGGWWGYLKEFMIFLPYIWPSKNRQMQFYLFLMGLLILVGRFFHVAIPTQTGIVVNRLTETAGTGELPWKEIAILFALEVVGSDAIIWTLSDCLSQRFNMWSWAQLEKMAFAHVMDLSMDFHDNKDSGEVIKAVEQANSLNQIIRLILFDATPIILDLVVGIGFVTHLFDIYFAFILLFTAIPFYLVSYIGTRINSSYRRVNTEKSRFLSKIQFQSISNWPLVSYFNRSTFEQRRLTEAVTENAESAIVYNDVSNAIMAAQDIVLFMAELGMMLLAAYHVSQGHAPIGNFIALKQFWSSMTYPIWVLAHFSRNFNNLLVDAERMLQLIQTKPKVVDKENAQDIKITKGTVKFSDVSFFYDKRKETIKNINFEVEGGKTIALVGETGSGKSTLLKLLFRFYDVSTGSIEIDGQDVRDIRLHSLREALGNVPQSGSLFNDTIRENIRYARLEATDEEIEEACKAACIHEKIMSFPDGYNTKVGERGVKLSGGELQRVSIARVILKNPQIVLLDEATSAVDSATEAAIQEAFEKLSTGRTTFVIAHRLSTIMDADMILVIDKGEIVERGSHEELLKKEDGKYAKLWETQTNKVRKAKEEPVVLLDI